jgi:hypothetical protein
VTEPRQTTATTRLEIAVAVQVAVFVVGVSWAFGGNADWVRTPISFWGSLGLILTLATLIRGGARSGMTRRTLPWIWPVAVLNVLVGISCLTSTFRGLSMGSATFMEPVQVDWWKPSVFRPDVTLRSIWLFDGIYFSCLNIALTVSRRRIIRILLAVAVGNALLLSIFGIVQKLMNSTGIYFGAVKSPQDFFFASFVYDNHWGSFCILMLGACIGLTLRYVDGVRGGGFFHGPALIGFTAFLVIGASIPLSGSRACTLLFVILTIAGIALGASRVSRSLRSSGASRAGTLAAFGFGAALTIGCVWMIAGDTIQARVAKTREQMSSMLKQGGLGSRSVLYRDSWTMANDRLLFGWGMGSYPFVFPLYNSQVSKVDRLPIIYHDAHSDWIQSAAEIGLAGTSLIAAAVLMPILAVRRVKFRNIPYFLLAACALIGAYAWIEFPFGNVAVVLSWWMCLFSAVQYARLSDRQDFHAG